MTWPLAWALSGAAAMTWVLAWGLNLWWHRHDHVVSCYEFPDGSLLTFEGYTPALTDKVACYWWETVGQ